jgi:hypothetical protein
LFSAGLGLGKPNSGLDPGETNSGSDVDSDETFQISRNVGLDIDEIVCLLDSQLCLPNSPWTGIIKSFPALESSVSDIPAGMTGKSVTFFTV